MALPTPKKEIYQVDTYLKGVQAYFSNDINTLFATANVATDIIKTYDEYDNSHSVWKQTQYVNVVYNPSIMKKDYVVNKIIQQNNYPTTVSNLCNLPEMKSLVYINDGTIYMIDNNEFKTIMQIPQIKPVHLAVSNDNQQIGLTTDSSILIYDVRNINNPVSLMKNELQSYACVTCLGFNGNEIITGHDNGIVKLWDQKQICMHKDTIVDIHCPNNTQYFFTTSFDKQVKLWNADGTPYNLKESLTLQRTEVQSTIPTKFNEHYDDSKNSINGYAGYLFGRTRLSPTAQYLAMSNNHLLNIINPYNKKVIYRYRLLKEVSITGIDFSSNEEMVLITDNSGKIHIIPLNSIKTN